MNQSAPNPSGEPVNSPVLPQLPHIQSDRPFRANFKNNHFTIGAGVAIFHLATARVVLCYYPPSKAWFLPKGRKDVNENLQQAAEREGFEESGYRNRLLPIPIKHRQPRPTLFKKHGTVVPFAVEPVWIQLEPVTAKVQYILHWYIAETVPPDVDKTLTEAQKEADTQYQYPPTYPQELKLRDRIAMEPKEYKPIRHPNTGVDEEEALYESYLLPIAEAMEKLKGTIQADVIRKGWEAIQLRTQLED